MIESYKSHPSVVTIKEQVSAGSLSFDLPPVSKEDINKIVKLLNANKATEPDEIPSKLITISDNVVDKYLTSIINYDISHLIFQMEQRAPLSDLFINIKTGKIRKITVQ